MRKKLVRCVAAVVLNFEGQLLLIKSKKRGAWELPGGKCNRSEYPAGAIRREVLEETGVEISLPNDSLELLVGDPVPGAQYASIIQVFAPCWARETAPPTDPIAGDDAEEARWFTKEEARQLQLSNLKTRDVLLQWLKT